MIFTRVVGASEETNEPVHKQYLSPPVIVVGIYDEKKLVDGQIEKVPYTNLTIFFPSYIL